MSLSNKEKLIKMYDILQATRQKVEILTADATKVAGKISPLLKLADRPGLWPAIITAGSTFVEIEVELGLFEATIDLARNRLGATESLGREVFALVKQFDYLIALGAQIPSLPNGKTIDDEIDDRLTSMLTYTQDIDVLRKEARKHVKEMMAYLE